MSGCCLCLHFVFLYGVANGTVHCLLYPDSGISMDEEIVLGVMMWSYNKAEL